MMLAMPSPMPLLTLATRRVAVVKSGSLRFRMIESPCASCEGTARSTVAPFGMRPELGTLTVSFEPSVAFDAEAADDEIALRNGVDLSVEAVQRRDQQRAAAQTLGIGDGVDGDVDGLPGLDEGRQHRVHRHRRHVLQLRRDVGRHRDAELRQHVVQRLHGERRLAGLIAGAVQTHHQPIAHQLIGAHALDLRQILDALGLRGRRRGQQSATSSPAPAAASRRSVQRGLKSPDERHAHVSTARMPS